MDYNKDLYEEESNDESKSLFNEEEYHMPSDIYFYKEEKIVEKPKKRGFRGSLFSYIAIGLVASLIGGIASNFVAPKLYGKILPNPNSYRYENATPVNINTSDNINTVSAVVKKAMSSVVGITTVEEVQQYWFSPQLVEGLGSGVIVHGDGYILTNSHVVAGGNAKSVTVLFENGDKLPANVLWSDSSLDLAIVKVEATNLPVADLGDSDDIEVGEIAVAIGNPLGLEFQRTVTSGIISGLHRSVQVSQNNIIEDLIQTDASINPGNSGGPLLNSKGQVIGINTAKIKSGEGLGFSIPINEAKMAIEEVINSGTYQTVFMGISGVSVEEYEGNFGIKLPADKGVVLLQVSADTPAHKAGLYNGDILTKIDDIEIDSMAKLKKTLYKYKLGDKAKLTVIRTNDIYETEIEFSQIK